MPACDVRSLIERDESACVVGSGLWLKERWGSCACVVAQPGVYACVCVCACTRAGTVRNLAYVAADAGGSGVGVWGLQLASLPLGSRRAPPERVSAVWGAAAGDFLLRGRCMPALAVALRLVTFLPRLVSLVSAPLTHRDSSQVSETEILKSRPEQA